MTKRSDDTDTEIELVEDDEIALEIAILCRRPDGLGCAIITDPNTDIRMIVEGRDPGTLCLVFKDGEHVDVEGRFPNFVEDLFETVEMRPKPARKSKKNATKKPTETTTSGNIVSMVMKRKQHEPA